MGRRPVFYPEWDVLDFNSEDFIVLANVLDDIADRMLPEFRTYLKTSDRTVFW